MVITSSCTSVAFLTMPMRLPSRPRRRHLGRFDGELTRSRQFSPPPSLSGQATSSQILLPTCLASRLTFRYRQTTAYLTVPTVERGRPIPTFTNGGVSVAAAMASINS